MGSLKDCLEKIYGFAGSPEAEAVAKKAAELKAEGYTAKEAAREAVKFFMGNLADERAAVLAQVQKNISPAEQPGQTAFDFAQKPGEQAAPEAEEEAQPSKGRFATEKADEGEGPPAGGSYKEMESPFIDLPELVAIAKELLGGKYPMVRRWIHRDPGVTGWFQAKGAGKIALRADIFEDWKQAAATLAHEIGHLVDYLPQRTMDRGNILGRIASLKHYMQPTMPKAPGAPGELTKKDRKRLKKEARKLIEAESADKWIDEEITKSMPITADDVLAIWNAAAKASEANPDLYRYVAGLDTPAKKAIVKEALKGAVASELQQFAKTVREKTGKRIPFTVTEQDILKRYEDLLKAEIQKRQLLSEEELLEELRYLSRSWKPFDPTADPNYTTYRYRGRELYADAFSAMMNAPEFVRARAPKFYEAWFNYLETAKPEFADMYNKIRNMYNSGEADKVWSETMRSAWREHNKLYSKELERAGAVDLAKRDLLDAHWFVVKKVHQVGSKLIKPGDNPQYKLEDWRYTGSEIEWLMTDVFRNIVRPLEKVGLSWEDLEEYSFHRRVTAPETEYGSRAKVANPFGAYPERSQKRLTKWKEDLSPAQWERLEDTHKEMHKLREYIIDKLEAAEIFGDDVLRKMRDAKNYARWDVAKYLEERHGRSAGLKIYKQYGTLNENAGPATATLMRDISFIHSINRQVAAKSIADFLNKHFKDEIAPAEKDMTGKLIEPSDPRKGLVAYLQHGRPVGWYVQKEIAEIFDENPIASAVITRGLAHLGNFFRTIFTEIRPGFWIVNTRRDFDRVRANIQGVWGFGTAKFAKDWNMALKPAFKSVFGIPEPVIEEMQKGNMLISVADLRGTRSEDMQIEKMLKRYHLRPLDWQTHILNPFGSAFTYWSNIGRALERTTKIATYRYMRNKFPDMSREELAHIIRNAGSPDFLRQGRWTPLTNNLLLFSNAAVQGYAGDIEAMTREGKKSFAAWWAKRLYRTILPKVLMWSAAAGIMGEGVRRIMEGVSEYDASNYFTLPLGLTNDGSSVYLRIPTDETGRFIGGITHKLLNAQKPELLAALFDYSAGQAPTLNPALDIFFDTVTYASGLNPYNHFTGRNAIPQSFQEARKADPKRAHLAFLKYIAGKAGLNMFYQFKYDDIERVKGELTNILGWDLKDPNGIGQFIKVAHKGVRTAAETPGLTDIVGRFVKEKSQGVAEKLRSAREQVSGRRMAENLNLYDAIRKSAAGKELDEDDRKAFQTSAVRELHDRLLSGKPIKPGELPLLSKTIDREIAHAMAKKYGMVFMQEWMAAQSNEEKGAVIKEFARINGQLRE